MELGAIFSALGLIFGAGAVIERGGDWVLLWPALAFVVVGGAYAQRPGVLGKRADGTLPIVTQIVLMPYFVFAWISWLILRISGEPACAEVSPGLWVGRRPTARDLPPQIDLVVDLTAEFPKSRSLRVRRYECLPTLDGTPPDARRLRALADELAGDPGPIYVHCAAGHARSATLAAAILIARGLARDADDAERIMRERRPGIRINPRQRRMLNDSFTSTGS
jgi:protein-tyrosine phosphatase